MKRIYAALVAVLMGVSMFTGCQAAGNPAAVTKEASDTKGTVTANNAENGDFTAAGADSAAEEKISVVSTIFPEYDWVRELVGSEADRYDLTMLLDNGVDLHSYQPTAQDIAKISNCDLFVYVGGESDGWVNATLKNVTNKDIQVINLLDVLGNSVKEEEVVEGMQAEKKDEGSDAAEEKEEYDEHVWLSLKNAKVLCSAITGALETIDPDHAKIYATNEKAYDEKVEKLDTEYQQMVEQAKRKTVLFGDRFPFSYLADDYELTYYAAFVGCSAESEASFETITFLANKVDELDLPCVLTIEGAKHKIAETIVQNTKKKNQKICTMDSMQSTISDDIQNGETYLKIMKDNLSVLKEALN